MKTTALFALSLLLIGLSIAGAVTQPAVAVIGGEYTLRAGETVHGNLLAVFAQVTIEAGARVDGDVIAHSSLVDLGGQVGRGINALESDVRLRDTAAVQGATRQTDIFGWPIVLPRIARIGK